MEKRNTIPHLQNEKEYMLWHTAKKRSEFKWSLSCYLIVNIFLTGVWYAGGHAYFWPIWCIMGWGLGLILQYLKAYHQTALFSTEKEYEKLKKESN